MIATGERARPLWAAYGLWAVPIGRDVVVRRGEFDPRGRRFRNLRQAVQRSHNSGVTVVLRPRGRGRRGDGRRDPRADARDQAERRRGFSMIRGRLFDGGAPDAVLAVARDRHGHVVARAPLPLGRGEGSLARRAGPRRFDAPNGVDERLVAETVAWGAEHGVERVSLAFAPFPELFENPRQFGRVGVLLSWITHLLDPLIRVERLYRYLRKYHAFDQERYVMLRKRQVVIVAITLLLLEFGS